MSRNFARVKEMFGGGDEKESSDELFIEEGNTIIRILPRSLKDMDDPDSNPLFYQVLVHYGLIDSAGNSTSAVCPKTNGRQNRCPICDLTRKLYNGSDAEKALGGRIYAKEQNYSNVLNLSKNGADGIQYMRYGKTIRAGILQFFNPEWGDISNITEGTHLVINKEVPEGNKMRTKYSVSVAGPGSMHVSVEELLPPNWKDKIDILETRVPKAASVEELEALLESSIEHKFEPGSSDYYDKVSAIAEAKGARKEEKAAKNESKQSSPEEDMAAFRKQIAAAKEKEEADKEKKSAPALKPRGETKKEMTPKDIETMSSADKEALLKELLGGE